MCEAVTWEVSLTRLSERCPKGEDAAGYYIEWSGQYENQISARKRLSW